MQEKVEGSEWADTIPSVDKEEEEEDVVYESSSESEEDFFQRRKMKENIFQVTRKMVNNAE